MLVLDVLLLKFKVRALPTGRTGWHMALLAPLPLAGFLVLLAFGRRLGERLEPIERLPAGEGGLHVGGQRAAAPVAVPGHGRQGQQRAHEPVAGVDRRGRDGPLDQRAHQRVGGGLVGLEQPGQPGAQRGRQPGGRAAGQLEVVEARLQHQTVRGPQRAVGRRERGQRAQALAGLGVALDVVRPAQQPGVERRPPGVRQGRGVRAARGLAPAERVEQA